MIHTDAISTIQRPYLRNAEILQFDTDACNIFRKYKPKPEALTPLYDQYFDLRDKSEMAMAREKYNEKFKLKSDSDRRRDRLHSSLFNYTKSILYDDSDPRLDAAQRIMNVITEVGNPTRLAENAETAMLTTLVNRLENCSDDLDTMGGRQHVEKIKAANLRFTELEKECRDLTASRALAEVPSMSVVRKEVDPVYRRIINTLNSLIDEKGKKEYENFLTDMNVLISKYNDLINRRKN